MRAEGDGDRDIYYGIYLQKQRQCPSCLSQPLRYDFVTPSIKSIYFPLKCAGPVTCFYQKKAVKMTMCQF